MAASIHYISLTCIILLVMQPLVAGIQCYVCDACPSPTNLQTVAGGASGYSCTKSTLMVGGSVSVVNRYYTLTNGCPEANSVVAGNGAIFNCCNTDKCNGSIAISSSLILTIGIAAVANLVKIIMAN